MSSIELSCDAGSFASQYSSSRRLPSRLFSSTRRLFGASSTSSSPATPTHGSSGSISSTNSRFTHGPNNSVSSITSVTSISTIGGGSVNQQRRLAEFATILGDYKLAMSVWETLRKEARGGSVRIVILSHYQNLIVAFIGRTTATLSSFTCISSPCRTCTCDPDRPSTSTNHSVRSAGSCAVQSIGICGTMGDGNRSPRLLELVA